MPKTPPADLLLPELRTHAHAQAGAGRDQASEVDEAAVLAGVLNQVFFDNVAGPECASCFVFAKAGYNDAAAAQVARNGLKVQALVEWIAASGLQRSQVLEAFGDHQATETGFDATMTVDRTEQLLRLSRLLVQATGLFGKRTNDWLTRVHDQLEGESPLLATRSALSTMRVRNMLVAIQHGGVA